MFDELIKDLVKIFNENAYLSVVLDDAIKNKKIKEEDKKLFTKILYGVTDKKIYLDFLTSEITKGKRLKPYFRNALRVVVYSLEYLNVKEYYIVKEVVEVCKKKDYKGAMFLNALIREYQRNKKPTLDKLDEVSKLSTKLSIPLDLMSLLYKEYGSEVEKFFVEPTVINTYRINTLVKNAEETVLKYLSDNNIDYVLKNNVLIDTKQSLINSPLFIDGILTAIDESSYMVAEFVNPSLNDDILDTCSAPGGKALSLSALMNNTGSITSCDIYPEKIKKIEDNIKRLHVNNVHTTLIDAVNGDYGKEYDKVLVDAPCSGLGTINHKPDLKYHLTIKDIDDIILLQKQILNNASKYVKKNGFLIYSTCTINIYENVKQIEKFLKEHPNFVKVDEKIILPGSTNDGFYMCKLCRN